jgi:ABC-type branched-subunit amino acid transport system permease subunit
MNCVNLATGIIAGFGGFFAGHLLTKTLMMETGSILYWVVVIVCAAVAIFLVGVLKE